MRWYEAFAGWLERRGRKRVIPDHVVPDRPYLDRYYILGMQGHRWGAIVLHRFHCSDEATLHSHPWPWLSVVLSGGYYEHTAKGRKWRRVGSVAIRSGLSSHRVELKLGRTVWTLFIMGPRIHDWFFRVGGRWVPHAKHLGIK